MKKSTLVAVAVLSWSAVFASTVVQAREPDVQWSVTIGSPVFGPPAPQYAPPYPMVTRPAPVYWPPLPVYAPRAYWPPVRWDRDGDGMPNRHDRVYNSRWDRDGDGVPNRHDRVYDPRWDQRGDGDADAHDRHHRHHRYDRDAGPGWRGR